MDASKASGSLTIVGTGIKVVGQTTIEARAHMEQADKLLFLVADPAAMYWIQTLNPTAESLQGYYGEGKRRLITYLEMVERILSCVRENKRVCAAFYGHPGVFVYPAHEAIKRARLEGFEAKMLPGISAEDCLFADLGIDPGSDGCQSFEATDFLLYNRKFDPTVSMILWQVSVIGELGYRTDRKFNPQGLQVLVDTLMDSYGPDHNVVLYEAAQYPICDPLIEWMPLSKVPAADVSPIATLYIPPKELAPINLEMCARLGISLSEIALPEVTAENAPGM